MLMNNTQQDLYGNYRNKTFSNIYEKVENFLSDYQNNGIPTTISEDSARTLYYLLFAKYGNSPIANADETQFTYKMWSLIFSKGPTWEKRLDIQKTLRGLDENEIMTGSRNVHQHAYNPGTVPTGAGIEGVNEQNTQANKRGKLDAYSYLWDLLAEDVTSEFISEFNVLFLQIVEPELPLLYISGGEER